MKRVIDVVGSALLLVITSPVIIGVALLVRLRLGRPVLHRQLRAGQNGRAFTLVKFRTMTEDSDESGTLLADEDRLTMFGRRLRATSLDELPELFNVLKGDMSLVGPRPLPTLYLPRYAPWQARRHEAKPGLTGWAQVNGRNSLSWDEKFRLDVWYVDNRSTSLDLMILLRTFLQVLKQQGIAAGGRATAPEFLGQSSQT